MVTDNRIATGLSNDVSWLEFHRTMVKMLQFILTTTGGILLIGIYYAASLFSLVGLYVSYGAERETNPLWCENESCVPLLEQLAMTIHFLLGTPISWSSNSAS